MIRSFRDNAVHSNSILTENKFKNARTIGFVDSWYKTGTFFSNRSITRNSHGCCLSLRFHIVVVFDNFKTMAAANSETKYQNVETNAFYKRVRLGKYIVSCSRFSKIVVCRSMAGFMYDGPWSGCRFQSVYRYNTPSIFNQSQRMYYVSYFITL